MEVNRESVLFMGYGDMACRLSHVLCKRGYRLNGIKRTPIEAAEVALTFIDCTDAKAMQSFFSHNHFDVIVITMTADEFTDAAYKKGYVQPIQCLLNTLQQTKKTPRQILFVSSTSVYHQADGQTVNETSPTHPERFNGKRILEAENLLIDSPFSTTIVRFSGIYGRNINGLLKQVIEGNAVLPHPIIYTNRIHIKDCVGILSHLIELSQQHEIKTIYIGTDDLPAPLYNVQQWLKSNLQQKGISIKSQPPQTADRGSKQCSNKAIIDSGYQFVYPDYKSGYADLLQQLKRQGDDELYFEKKK